MTLEELSDPETGRIRVRMVDTRAEAYQVARSYMIRLEPHDFEEPQLSHLAAHTNLSAEAFKAKFLPLVMVTVCSLRCGRSASPRRKIRAADFLPEVARGESAAFSLRHLRLPVCVDEAHLDPFVQRIGDASQHRK